MTTLPPEFNPDLYDEIPYGNQTLFEGRNMELENLAREKIRLSLERRLSCGIVGRDDLHSRFGMKKLGYSQNDLMTGKVKLR